MTLSLIDGGFADPVFDAQSNYRKIMKAFAEPGTLVELCAPAMAPSAISAAAAAFLLTLADQDTPVWIEADDVRQKVADWLAFHTGAAQASRTDAASFALLTGDDDAATWKRFSRGTSEYPDRSATLIIAVQSLSGGAPLLLRGPGIETACRIAAAGLPSGFLLAMEENRALYPRGLDVVLVSGSHAVAIPRSIAVKEA